MELKGEQLINAPRDIVWAAINDPEVLRTSIPGCEELEGSVEDGFTAKVVIKIGPIKAKFTGSVTISDINAPATYRLAGEGKGGVAGFAKGGADVTLSSEDNQTRLTYVCTVQIGGKLAQLGSRLIDSTAKKLADVFFLNLAGQISADGKRR
jgi:carbon monoxide dehydrogenase subunit G